MVKVKCPETGEIIEYDESEIHSHFLMCGDSTKEEDVAKLMNGVKADMVFTDPPYGMNLDTDWSGAKSKLQFYQEKGCKGSGNKYERVIGDNEDFKPELVTTIFNNFDYCKEIFVWGADYYPELLKDYKLGNMFVWDKRSNDDTNIDYVEQSDKMFGSQFELCWSKNKHRKQIARVKWAGIFGTEKEFDKKRVHPTQKPTSLSSWFIDKYSKENDLIVDIYGGSGSTLIACEQLNRNCYMMELDCKYIQVIIERYIAFTGNKVYRLNDDGTKTDWEDIK
jgi:DNA modification methylase